MIINIRRRALSPRKWIPPPAFFFSFLAALWHMELLGQGLDSSHSRNLNRSCGNAVPLTHCAGWGSGSQSSQDASDPVAPQWELGKGNLDDSPILGNCFI